MEIEVAFPGGKQVDAKIGPFEIRTDQSLEHGGEGSAPEPFALFLASLATCAGFYALAFCQARGIATEGLRVVQRSETDAKGHLESLDIEVTLPAGFPEKYRTAIQRAVDGCKVKKALLAPPAMTVRLADGGSSERIAAA